MIISDWKRLILNKCVRVNKQPTLNYVSSIVTVHLYDKCFVFYFNSDVILTCGQLQMEVVHTHNSTFF